MKPGISTGGANKVSPSAAAINRRGATATRSVARNTSTSTGPELSKGARFRFTTFGFPVEAEVTEYVPPAAGQPARVAWHGWVEGDADHRLDVHHAWLLEDLPGGRPRILTQESQIGKPAQELARTRPNPMLNAHQEWIDGIAHAAAKRARA